MKRGSLLFLTLASPLILLTFWTDSAWAPPLFALLSAAFPVALIAIGASRGQTLGPLLIPLVALALLLEACVIAMLVLSGQGTEGPWIGGLPASPAVLICGIWLLPQALVSLAYALSFDHFTLRDEDLARLRDITSSHAGQGRSENA